MDGLHLVGARHAVPLQLRLVAENFRWYYIFIIDMIFDIRKLYR